MLPKNFANQEIIEANVTTDAPNPGHGEVRLHIVVHKRYNPPPRYNTVVSSYKKEGEIGLASPSSPSQQPLFFRHWRMR